MIPRQQYGSLFCGAGLLDRGLHAVLPELDCLFGFESDKGRRAIFKEHFRDADVHSDLADWQEADLPRVDGLVGGVPCNLFSTANTSAGNSRHISDGPAQHAFNICERLQPTWCLWESSGKDRSWKRWVPAMRSEMWAQGFSSVSFRVCPSVCGAPHERVRAFVVAWRTFVDADREAQSTRAVHAQVARLREAPVTLWDGRIPPGLVRRLDDGTDTRVGRAIGYGVDQRTAQTVGTVLAALLPTLGDRP